MRYNTIKKPIWYLMMTVLSVQGLFAQSSLSLSNCLDQVRSTSAAKQQIVLSEQTSGIQKQITSRNFYPQASLGAKATWQSTVTSLPIDIPGLMVPSVPKDQYAATLDVTQMIYDGGMTKALHNIQDMQSQLKIHQLETDVLNSETQAIDLFFQIALQQNLIINAQLLEEQLEASLNQAEKLLNGGVVDRRDVASIRIKLLETTQKIQESKYYASAAKRSLASLMQTQDTAFAIVLPDRAEVARNSFENRPEIHLLESRSDLLLAQNDLNDAQVRPSLATFINAGYGRPGLNFLANSFDWYALGGIKLSIPIDHVYTRKREMRNQINQLEIRSAELSKSDLLQKFDRLEIQYREEWQKLNDWLEEDRNIVDLRTEMQSISEAKWKAGVITTIEYLSEITELNVAKERLSTHETLLTKIEALLKNLYAIN